MIIRIKNKKYSVKPNKNFILLLVCIFLFIWIVSSIRSCTKFDKTLRGAEYAAELVELPEYRVRPCTRPDGTPSADYTEVYPAKTGDKVVYLTFDDGPSKKVTPQVLDILKKYDVKATFFIIAKNAAEYPELVKRMADEGHAVASHTFSHNYSNVYADTESFRSEIFEARDALIDIVGEDKYTDIFRFPGGAFTNQREEFKEVLIEEDIPFVNWNCLTGDAETSSPKEEDIIARAKSSAKSADSDSLIMLMHDAGAKQVTADALPEIIEYFRSKGYRFDALRRY